MPFFHKRAITPFPYKEKDNANKLCHRMKCLSTVYSQPDELDCSNTVKLCIQYMYIVTYIWYKSTLLVVMFKPLMHVNE